MKTVDVRGLSCPEPVMLTSEALKSKEALLVLANEAHTVKNISRLLEKSARTFEVKEINDEYEIHVK